MVWRSFWRIRSSPSGAFLRLCQIRRSLMPVDVGRDSSSSFIVPDLGLGRSDQLVQGPGHLVEQVILQELPLPGGQQPGPVLGFGTAPPPARGRRDCGPGKPRRPR